jgi:glycosyltransferase involved in cell wall biosynthesis
METASHICVVVPVYNHALTAGRVVREAGAFFPVIAVNDGSTDGTDRVLAEEKDITIITLPANQGKGAALRAGFAAAEKLGFTHAITIDADGQHSTAALPEFAAACRLHPDTLIVGVRDLIKEGAPRGRRFTNNLSTFWFKVETGVPLADTQCGYRCYPLSSVNRLRVKTQRYAYELEVMVKAAWAGIPLLARPVTADYAAPTSRLSHFDPWRDMVQISRLHSRLSMQAFCVPALLRKLSATGQLHHLPRGQRVRTILRHLFSEHTESPGRLAAAVGLGLFCGIAPIWGFQIITAVALAHKFRLNKAIAVTASHVSFPLAAPFILAAGLMLGHYLWTGGLIDFRPEAAARQIPLYFAEWFFGSIVLAILAGTLGTLVAWLISRAVAREKTAVSHD